MVLAVNEQWSVANCTATLIARRCTS